MSLKAALVGCGKFADSHAEEIAKLSNGRLAAVCDNEPLMAEQLAVRFGNPRQYSDLDSMLERERPDVLHIVTPPHTHLELGKRAVDAGCHIFVEKPLALNSADAGQLIAYARQAGRKLTTGWRVNFDPPALLLERLIDEGVLGEPVHMESFYGYDLGGPFGPAILASKDHWVRKLPGQLFHNNIDHLLNKFPRFFGGRMPSIFARCSCFRGQGNENDLPDELSVFLEGRASGFARFSANIKPTAHTFTIFGTKQTIHVDYVCRTVTFAAGPTLPSAVGRLLGAFGQAWQFYREGMRNVARFLRSDYHFNAGLGTLIGRFYDSILNDTPPPIPYEDILWVNRVMDEVFEQTTAAAGVRSGVC